MMILSRRSAAAIANLLVVIMLSSLIVIIPGTADVSAASAYSATGRINSKEGAYLRKGPSKSTKIVALLNNRKQVTITREVFTRKGLVGATHKWYAVKVGNKRGYVRSDLVTVLQYTERQAWTAKTINYRSGPGTFMLLKGTLKKGTPVTVVLSARMKKSKKIWYRVKVGNKYSYVSQKGITFTQPAVVQEDTTTVVVQSAASRRVAKNAVNWAINIANDNTFHYGNGLHAHHCGCYFCGTQPRSKQKHIKYWEKTYCCNPFVHAAYAHGGNEPTMLAVCQRGGAYDWESYKTSPLFAALGHPDMSELKTGDILCFTGHVAMYAGNGQLVEAGLEDYGKKDQRWNDSIAVSELTENRYKSFKKVYRYIGAN